jgi:protein-S-isoprenylcysteine O-methyltransferase Ste14
VTITAALARRRVALGFALAALVLWLSAPTLASVVAGALVAAIGESIRIWAAGHVEKSREVTRSGPYAFTRHPLYVGSCVVGAGVAIASASWIVAAVVFVYLATTITAAIRSEEAHLREKFGAEYDAYAQRVAPPMVRSFSVSRALVNREHHAIAGLIVALVLLALKAGLWVR